MNEPILDALRVEPWELFYPQVIWHNDKHRDIRDTPIVYKLFDGPELVYVGSTCASLRGRLRWHRDTKEYGNAVHVWYFDTAKEMEYFERLLIRKYQPRYNAEKYSSSYKFDLRPRHFNI